MLLTITTNAVVTFTQNILSNVIVELRVLAALLGKFASEPMKASRAKCRQWHAMLHQQGDHQEMWQGHFDMSRCRSVRSFPAPGCCRIGYCSSGS